MMRVLRDGGSDPGSWEVSVKLELSWSVGCKNDKRGYCEGVTGVLSELRAARLASLLRCGRASMRPSPQPRQSPDERAVSFHFVRTNPLFSNPFCKKHPTTSCSW